ERRDDLAGDLVDRPIPGGDQAADADRLLHQGGRAAVFLELEVLQHLDAGGDVRDANAGLGGLRQAGRGAHFLGDRLGDVGEAGLVGGQHALQEVDPLFTAGLREGDDRLLGGGDILVDVRGRAGGDVARHFLVGRVDHV